MLFLCGCDCLYFSDILAYGYAITMLNVIRSDITIKNLIVLAWIGSLINPNKGWLGYVCFDLVVC